MRLLHELEEHINKMSRIDKKGVCVYIYMATLCGQVIGDTCVNTVFIAMSFLLTVLIQLQSVITKSVMFDFHSLDQSTIHNIHKSTCIVLK